MTAVLVLFGVLGAFAALLIVTLLRRGSGRTENADGLLIEQDRRLQAHSDRTSYNAFAAHNSVPTMSDSQRYRR
ncbi:MULTISPECIES: hypothetical protein [Streptomyces]|uniref:Secreted protein n=1 Tax=Streptomyces solicathayae TaxID=3081768 RepID=A0ABZ0M3A3_9ACTN|nr:hypothetical protein [Streptomyces sp. HUAS YS2]WOX26257.1 hypothetical protein R2D22_34690 [Streptomyces sp. HUAS YS2]